MASINGVSSGNRTSSLYNSSKTISGLASGLDTEGMIEGLVQGYQSKITSLNQKATKIQWKQDAYRDIISRMAKFTEKYTSYASSTNLMSTAFFNNAMKVAAQGANADKVSASGKTSSEVVLNSVERLATAARYVTGSNMSLGDGQSITASTELDLDGSVSLGNLQGSLSLTYGDRVVSISFDEVADKFDGSADDAEKLAEAIRNKLKDQKITLKSGESVAASDRIEVSVEDGKISFSDKSSAGNSVYLSGASGNIGDVLGLNLDNAKEDRPSVIELAEETKLTKTIKTVEYLSGKTMSMTLNKLTKSIKLPEIVKTGEGESATYKIKDASGDLRELNADNYTAILSAAVKEAFGDKVEVVNKDESGKLQLEFRVQEAGSDLLINTDVGESLGIGKTASSYLNTGKTLGELLGSNIGDELEDFEINGKVVGKFNKDSKLSDVMNAINSNTAAGVKVSYSKTTREFVFTAGDTGAQSEVKMGSGLAQKMFGTPAEGAGYTKGEDAVFTVTVNGTEKHMKRSSNSVDIDGLTLNFKESFTTGGSVTFKSSADADKIVNAVKDMIKDYNEMMVEVKKAYSTLPAQKSNGASYEPLTDNDQSSMSESAVKQYEEKAKQGLLFGDSVLSGLYDKLRFIFSPTGDDGAMLRKMGITSGYSGSDGASVALDEGKLRAMLESDPEAVAEAFTKSTESGAATNGVMQNVKTQMDNYGRLSGATKGILVERAGSPLSPLSLLKNTFQDQIDDLNKQISSWEDKLAAKVDSYTSQFSRLETLINQMNSQSSMLYSMTGMGG